MIKARRVCCICFGLSGGFAIQESFRFTSGFEPVSELTESHFFVKVIWQRGSFLEAHISQVTGSCYLQCFDRLQCALSHRGWKSLNNLVAF